MTRHVALLRGINLGAKRRVSMPELRELLTSAGYDGVSTHMQSGNVVLTSEMPAARLAAALEACIHEALGIAVDVTVRTRDELATVVERDPFGDLAADPRLYQVNFLSGEPEPGIVEELAAVDVAPERFRVSGREIYAWHPNGIQKSPLARLLTARRLGVTVTARNWNTVTTLFAMASERDE